MPADKFYWNLHPFSVSLQVPTKEGQAMSVAHGASFSEASVADNTGDLYRCVDRLLAEVRTPQRTRKFSVTKMLGSLIGDLNYILHIWLIYKDPYFKSWRFYIQCMRNFLNILLCYSESMMTKNYEIIFSKNVDILAKYNFAIRLGTKTQIFAMSVHELPSLFSLSKALFFFIYYSNAYTI